MSNSNQDHDKTLKQLIEADQPVILWGDPGIGKTAMAMALAGKYDHIEVLRGATMDPTDVLGMPALVNGEVLWAPSTWARRAREALDKKKRVWLILDELSCAPPSVQAPLLALVHERRAGEVSLEGSRVIATANPSESAADGGFLPPAMAARFAHLHVEPSPSKWVDGELGGWGDGPSWGRGIVAAYIRKNPTALLSVEKKLGSDDGDEGYPNPRAWSAVSNVLDSTKDVAGAGGAIRAIIGSGAATSFLQWHASADLPDPEDILSGRAKLPQRGDQVWATLAAVVSTVMNKPTDERVLKAWHILDSVRPDIALSHARVLMNNITGNIPEEAMTLGRRILGVTENG